jgi:hypothetical protein
MTTASPSLIAKRPGLWPLRITVLALAGFTYLVACCCPSLYFVTSADEHFSRFGFVLLLIGWSGVFAGQFAWFANLFLFLAWIFILCRLWLTAAVIALLGILIALDTRALLGQILDADEGGVNKMHVESIGIGFYIWLGSMIITLLGCVLLRILGSKPRQVVVPGV